jgi:hypothetical protein
LLRGVDLSPKAFHAPDGCEKTGAEDVSSTGEARADFAKTDKPLPRRRVHDEA